MNKNWFYVSIASCIGSLIWAVVIFAITLFVPFSVGANGLIFTYQVLPVIGNGNIFNYFAVISNGVGNLLGEGLIEITNSILTASLYIFYGTLIADILFSIVLMIFRNRYLRIVLRTISIILAIAIVLTFITWLYYMVGVAGLIFGGADINLSITNSGLVFAFGFALLNGIFIERQFKFFAKPYKLTKKQYKDLQTIFHKNELPEDYEETKKKPSETEVNKKAEKQKKAEEKQKAKEEKLAKKQAKAEEKKVAKAKKEAVKEVKAEAKKQAKEEKENKKEINVKKETKEDKKEPEDKIDISEI